MCLVACGGGSKSDQAGAGPVVAPQAPPASAPTGNTDTPPATLNGRSLVWHDEFSADGLPDATKWAYDTYRNKWGWYNGELQYYGNARLQNNSISRGVLSITALREALPKSTFADSNNQSFSSARLITLGKYTFTYGFVEVRAKLPCSLGTWPAIWMLGEATDNAGIGPNAWPAPGEIDIMEQRGLSNGDKQVALATLHMAAHWGGAGISASQSVRDACTAFHDYQLTWSANKIELGVDGTVYNTYYRPAGANNSTWPFDKPQYLLLNLAMGGSLGGPVPSAFITDSMQVDYVRVYQ